MKVVSLSRTSLAPRTGRGVRVAVIDSGVHQGHPHVGPVRGGVGIDAAGNIHPDFVDRLGHGTAVAAAIREKAPDVELIVVKVFDGELTATGRALVAAIEWAATEQADIINLSLGTLNPDQAPALAAAVSQALRAGAIIVSAAPHPGAEWLPGALEGVRAVAADWECPRDECLLWTDDEGRERMSASAYPRPIPGVPPEKNFRGLSFAVANASGLLALTLERE